MAEPKSNKTLWLMVIGLMAVVALILVINPVSGEDETAIEAAEDEASVDRDDTLSDYPIAADPYGETSPGDETRNVQMQMPVRAVEEPMDSAEETTIAE